MRFLGKAQIEALKKGASNIKSDVVTDAPASATTTNVPATAEQPKKKKWLMPVLIGGGVLVIGILTYVLLKKNK